MRIWQSFATICTLGFSIPLLWAGAGRAQGWCDNPNAVKDLVEAAIATRSWQVLAPLEQCSDALVTETLNSIIANGDRLTAGDLSALEEIGRGNREVVTAFSELLRENGSSLLRFAVTRALQDLDTSADRVIPDALATLDAENSQISQQAATLVPLIQEAVPLMISALDGGSTEQASRQLQRLGTRAQLSALSLLGTILQQGATDIRSGNATGAFDSTLREICEAEDEFVWENSNWGNSNWGNSNAIAPGNTNAPRLSKRDRILTRHCQKR